MATLEMEWEPEEEYIYPSAILDGYLDRLAECDAGVLGDLTALLKDKNNGLTANDLETMVKPLQLTYCPSQSVLAARELSNEPFRH